MTNSIELKEVLRQYRWFNDTVDIALVYYLFYRILLLIKGTRAFQMLMGLGLIVLVLVTSQWLKFYTLDWLIHSFWSQIVLAIVILFQPEIRRTLAQVGQRHFFRALSPVEGSKFIEETVKAAVSMANKRIGALMVLERETDLTTIVEMGTELEAKVTKELLTSIFLPYSPIHDGAAIIRNGRIVAAGCFPAAHAFVEPLQIARHEAPRRGGPHRRNGRRRRRRIRGDRRDLGGHGRRHRAERGRAPAQKDDLGPLREAEKNKAVGSDAAGGGQGERRPGTPDAVGPLRPRSSRKIRVRRVNQNSHGLLSGRSKTLSRELGHQARVPRPLPRPLVQRHLQRARWS